MTKMEKDIEYIKRSLDENKEDHIVMMGRIDNWIEASERKFAGHWTEGVLVWTGIGVGSALIIAFMNLILK